MTIPNVTIQIETPKKNTVQSNDTKIESKKTEEKKQEPKKEDNVSKTEAILTAIASSVNAISSWVS